MRVKKMETEHKEERRASQLFLKKNLEQVKTHNHQTYDRREILHWRVEMKTHDTAPGDT